MLPSEVHLMHPCWKGKQNRIRFLLNGLFQKFILFFYILFFIRSQDFKVRFIFLCRHLTAGYYRSPEIIGIIPDLGNINEGAFFVCVASGFRIPAKITTAAAIRIATVIISFYDFSWDSSCIPGITTDAVVPFPFSL